MIKRIKERPLGYNRAITHDVMFCDACGRRIMWCVPTPKGHFCEKCRKQDANRNKRW